MIGGDLGRITPEEYGRHRYGNDFDLLCKVAQESGVTIEEAARTLSKIRGPGMTLGTSVTCYVSTFKPKPPRAPLWLRVASRVVNFLKWLGIGADTKGAKG